MDEIEIISSEENKTKVQNLSIEELQNYKRELKEMIKFLENEIIKKPKINANGDNCTGEKIKLICQLILRLQLLWIIIFVLIFL